MTTEDQPLRFTTWLAPGLPLELFDIIAGSVSAGLGRRYVLLSEPKISGPLSPEDDPFATGETDVGFLCPPSYLWLTRRPQPSVTLVPLAPIHDDPRTGGRPVYLSDLVVRADSPLADFTDLAGRRVGFNDRASLSGFGCLLARLEADGLDPSFFAELRQVGSHRRALDLIDSGQIDAAAIDGNVWRTWCDEQPGRRHRLRSIDALGPHPVQPVVTRASAGPELAQDVADQLARPELAAALAPLGVIGFGPVSDADYQALAPAVDRAMALGGGLVG